MVFRGIKAFNCFFFSQIILTEGQVSDHPICANDMQMWTVMCWCIYLFHKFRMIIFAA